MSLNGWLQIALYVIILLLITKPLGSYIYRVMTGQRTFLHPVVQPVERLVDRLIGVREDEEQTWAGYAVAVLVFSLFGVLVTYLQQRTQAWLPLNYGMK